MIVGLVMDHFEEGARKAVLLPGGPARKASGQRLWTTPPALVMALRVGIVKKVSVLHLLEKRGEQVLTPGVKVRQHRRIGDPAALLLKQRWNELSRASWPIRDQRRKDFVPKLEGWVVIEEEFEGIQQLLKHADTCAKHRKESTKGLLISSLGPGCQHGSQRWPKLSDVRVRESMINAAVRKSQAARLSGQRELDSAPLRSACQKLGDQQKERADRGRQGVEAVAHPLDHALHVRQMLSAPDAAWELAQACEHGAADRIGLVQVRADDLQYFGEMRTLIAGKPHQSLQGDCAHFFARIMQVGSKHVARLLPGKKGGIHQAFFGTRGQHGQGQETTPFLLALGTGKQCHNSCGEASSEIVIAPGGNENGVEHDPPFQRNAVKPPVWLIHRKPC